MNGPTRISYMTYISLFNIISSHLQYFTFIFTSFLCTYTFLYALKSFLLITITNLITLGSLPWTVLVKKNMKILKIEFFLKTHLLSISQKVYMKYQRDRRRRALFQHQNFNFLFYLGWAGCFTQSKHNIMKVVQS